MFNKDSCRNCGNILISNVICNNCNKVDLVLRICSSMKEHVHSHDKGKSNTLHDKVIL
jgi:hypothetical protein